MTPQTPDMQVVIERLEKQNRRLKLVAVVISFLAGLGVLSGPMKSGDAIRACQPAAFANQTNLGNPKPVQEMWFEGHKLTIGMTRSEILSALASCCALNGRNDSYFIMSPKAPPSTILGAIWFTGDRLTAIRHDLEWFPTGDAVKLARAIYHGLFFAGGKSPQTVILETHTSELTNGTAQTITVSFSTGRSIEVEVANTDNPENGVSVNLYEGLK